MYACVCVSIILCDKDLKSWGILEKISVEGEQSSHFSVSTWWLFFSPAKMLTWLRANSQFHSLDLAAIFLGAMVVAGV